MVALAKFRKGRIGVYTLSLQVASWLYLTTGPVISNDGTATCCLPEHDPFRMFRNVLSCEKGITTDI
jgi:hypothetical protein